MARRGRRRITAGGRSPPARPATTPPGRGDRPGHGPAGAAPSPAGGASGPSRPGRQATLFFLLLLGAFLYLTWLVFKPFVIFMVMGVLVAVLALPIDRMWEKIFPNRLAALFTIFTLFIIIAAPLVGIGFALFEETERAVDAIQEGKVQEALDDAVQVFYPNATAEERNETVDQLWQQLKPRVESALRSFAANSVSFIADLFLALVIILFVVYYVLTDGWRLVEYFRHVTPLPPAQVDYLLEEAQNGLKAVFMGQILTSLIQGTLGGIGFLVAGVPGAILWAAVMAILSLLPVVGAFLVWVPAAIWLFVTGEVGWGIFLVVWGVVVVSQIDNFVRPKLIGDRAQIHPIFVLIGVLGGVAAFGFIGLFLGPLLVGILIALLRVWERDYRQEPRFEAVPFGSEEE